MSGQPVDQQQEVVHQTLFTGADIQLDAYEGGHPLSIVTFEARDKRISAVTPSRFGPGFGRGRFAPMGFNEYLIKRNRNHWFQTAEIEEVAEIVRQRTEGTRVITYGSSMGGFAAINFAPMLGAHSFIAVSPLHDVSLGNEAGDRRWVESAQIDFTHSLIRSGECRDAEGYVFYAFDGHDEKHADLIQRDTAATLVPVEYGGHPCSFYINATYKLKRIIAEVAAGEFALDTFRRDIDAATLDTYYPYERQALQAAQADDLHGAIERLGVALQKSPGLPRLLLKLGELQRRIGDIEESERTYRSVLADHPHSAEAQVGISHALAARGEFTAAVHAVHTAIRIKPRHQYYSRLAEWLIRTGDLREAEQALMKVIELEPAAVVAPKRLEALRRRMTVEAEARAARSGIRGLVRRMRRR